MVTVDEQERAHLAQSDRHIADAERHVSEQEARVARLRAAGHDVSMFDGVLQTLRATLAQHRAHRAVILQRLGGAGDDAFGRGQGT